MDINLKEMLKTIKTMKYEIPKGEDPYELACEMLKHIGSPDSELRDDLIYGIMAKWIIGDVFTSEQMKEMLSKLLSDEYFLKGLGQKGDETLVRSFAVLQVTLLLYKHVRVPYLSKEEMDKIFNTVMTLIPREIDLRGFEQEKGWFHIAAHLGDLLDEMVYVKDYGDKEMYGILKAVQFMVYKDSVTYLDFEEQRLSEAVFSMVKEKRLDNKSILLWLEGFSISQLDLQMPEKNRLRKNIKGFLHSCYFKLKKLPQTDDLIEKIESLIEAV